MPFTVIHGTFHVIGCSPDGDSVRFRPTDPAHLNRLEGQPARLNRAGCAQLRFEAIDTPERHYEGFHQPQPWPDEALRFTLEALGIRDVIWDQAGASVKSASEGSAGYIVARAVEKNRRPVAFVFAGPCPEPDGAELLLTPERVRESVNHRLVAAGLAYPTYYEKLFYDLRDAFTEAVRAACAAGRGVWRDDRSRAVEVGGVDDLTQRFTILPKLFRRLCDHLAAGGAVADFRAYLARRSEEVLVLSRGQRTHYDTLVEVSGHTVSLTVPPEDLVFRET